MLADGVSPVARIQEQLASMPASAAGAFQPPEGLVRSLTSPPQVVINPVAARTLEVLQALLDLTAAQERRIDRLLTEARNASRISFRALVVSGVVGLVVVATFCPDPPPVVQWHR
jgi:hypothetical protein